jgi:hypothetical protein
MFQSIISRHDPGRWSKTLKHRPKAELPFDPLQVPTQSPALAELAVTIGALDPADRRTQATLTPIIEVLTRINPARIIVPSYEIWLEATVMAGILARTQAIPKPDRRKFLNDTLLFLQAADASAVMISRNSRDLDLLLQINPRVGVLLYDKNE